MTHTIAFDPSHPELLLDLDVPAGRPPETGWPVIVWIHGGGWRLQDRTARPDFSRHFCSAGFAMASIDYRLAPEHPHPAQVHDLRQALRWLRRQANEFGLDSDSIGLGVVGRCTHRGVHRPERTRTEAARRDHRHR